MHDSTARHERIPTRVALRRNKRAPRWPARLRRSFGSGRRRTSPVCSGWRPVRRPSASMPSWFGCIARKGCRLRTSSRSISTSISRCSRSSCKAIAASCASICSITWTSGPKNAHVPDGTIPVEQVGDYCRAYEQQIKAAGGLDLQLLGIGRTGHIGFNEPGSPADSRTRLITLDRVTRMDAASDFFGEEYVPRRAITMGVGTILEARRVILMAFGEGKAAVVAQAVEGPVTQTVAASFLQQHPNAVVVLDEAAAASLTRFKRPWLLGPVQWDPPAIRKAVIWLAQTMKKPILKLTDEDYNESGLQDLLAAHGPAYDINIDVFRAMQETITGWPGGKPDPRKRPGDIRRRTDSIFPKRVLIFSPHPDDDVISMGGTLIRLVDQGHEVHVAYQTSGNIAVFDADAVRFADFVADFNRHFGIGEGAETARAPGRGIRPQQEAGPGGQPDAAADQGPDPPRRGAGGGAGLRRAGRAAALPGSAVLRDGHGPQEAARRGRHPAHGRAAGKNPAAPDLCRRRSVRSARHAPRLPGGDHAGGRAHPRARLVPQLRSLALSRRLAGMGAGADRDGRAAQPAGTAAQADRDLQASEPEGPGDVPRPRRARILAAGRRPQPPDRRLYDQLGLAEYEAIEGFVQWFPPSA